MRLELGLDLPERRIGLTAHDFAQLLGAREVILSHAAKIAGTPTVPSRFIQRLAAVAGARWQAARRARRKLSRRGRAHSIGRQAVAPAPQPAPKPPRAARPTRLSVTEIEDWLRDPYTIYAKHILRLAPLDAVDHRARRRRARHHHPRRHRRVSPQRFADGLPADPARELIALGEPHFAALEDFPEARAFWWPRFKRIARLVRRLGERAPRRIAAIAAEIGGEIEIPLADGSFRLSGIADRIERQADGGYVILDYKTGSARSEKQVRTGLAPQLTLEAAMLRQRRLSRTFRAGAFGRRIGLRDAQGRASAGEYEADRVHERHGGQPGRSGAGKSLSALARASTTRASRTARSSIRCGRSITATYDHLARVKEWSATGGEDRDVGAANETAGIIPTKCGGSRAKRPIRRLRPGSPPMPAPARPTCWRSA